MLNFSSPSGQTQPTMLRGGQISTETQISRWIDPLTSPRHNQPRKMADHQRSAKYQNTFTQSLPKTLCYGTRITIHDSNIIQTPEIQQHNTICQQSNQRYSGYRVSTNRLCHQSLPLTPEMPRSFQSKTPATEL